MSVKFLFFALLLFAPFASAELPGIQEIYLGQQACVVDYVSVKISDGTLDVTGTEQRDVGGCGGQDPGVSNSSPGTDNACQVALGTEITIRNIWYSVANTLGVDEQCKVGLSVDTAGGEPFDFVAWASIDVGSATTTIANCDESSILDSISMKTGDDSCHVSDPAGAVISTVGDSWRMLIDEADTGTPSCMGLVSLNVIVEVMTCSVPFP